MKVLCYCESPVIQTGAGRVSQPLIKLMLQLGWELTIVGLNHFGDVPFNKEEWPCTFINADIGDYFQPEHAKEAIRAGGYDMLFLSGDINTIDVVMPDALEARAKWGFPIISLVVIDADFDMPYLHFLYEVDYPFVYSQFAYDVAVKRLPSLKEKLQLIPLWFEPDVLYRMEPEKRQRIRQEILGIESLDTFVILSFNRNQRRKDLGRVMYAYHLFHQKYPNSKLYMHAKMKDLGGHLPSQAHLLGLHPSEVIFTHESYSVVSGYDRNIVNQIYNAADISISCSQGEGWGLSTSESMAAGIPFIGPRHTTFLDLIGRNEERGYLAACGGPDLWQIHYSLGEEPRPVTSVTSMVDKLEHVYLHYKEAMEKAAMARAYAEEHTLKDFQYAWLKVFNYADLCCTGSPRHHSPLLPSAQK